MADYTTCPALLEQTSSARWRHWRGIASLPPRSTPASRCSSLLMSPCATAPCPTAHPRITSSYTSAWAGRQTVQGKGRSPQASFVSFLLSVNAGQHTDLQRFLTLKAIYGFGTTGALWSCLTPFACICICVLVRMFLKLPSAKVVLCNSKKGTVNCWSR